MVKSNLGFLKCNLGLWRFQPGASEDASWARGESNDRTSPRGWRLVRPVGFAQQACGGFQKAFGPERESLWGLLKSHGVRGRWQGSRTCEAVVTHGKVSIQRQQSQVPILKSPCSIQCKSLFPFQKSGIKKKRRAPLLRSMADVCPQGRGQYNELTGL